MRLNNNIVMDYPCLKAQATDYKESTLNFLLNECTYNEITDEVQIYFIHDINSNYINKYIQKNVISAYIRVYAPEKNYFKFEKIMFISKNKYINLDAKKILGDTYVSLVLIANEDINDFSSLEFECQGNYQIKKNSIIGYSEEIKVEITKEDMTNLPIESIFKIVYNQNILGNSIKYKYEGDYIMIICPEENIYTNIKSAINISNNAALIYQTLISPALVNGIININEEKYTKYKWNKLLKIKLENSNTNNLTYEKALIIAQKLLNNPLEKMFENIVQMEKEYD